MGYMEYVVHGCSGIDAECFSVGLQWDYRLIVFCTGELQFALKTPAVPVVMVTYRVFFIFVMLMSADT